MVSYKKTCIHKQTSLRPTSNPGRSFSTRTKGASIKFSKERKKFALGPRLHSGVSSSSSSWRSRLILCHFGFFIVRDNNSNTENAICLIYNGSLCSESFNQRLSRPPVPRLFVKKYNITGTEMIMQEIFNILDTLSSKIKEPSCKAIFKRTACSLVMPECAEEEQKALQLCREDCEHIFKVCKSSTQFVLGAIDIVMKDKGYYFFHSNFPTDCSYYKYSYNGAKCMQLLKDIGKLTIILLLCYVN